MLYPERTESVRHAEYKTLQSAHLLLEGLKASAPAYTITPPISTISIAHTLTHSGMFLASHTGRGATWKGMLDDRSSRYTVWVFVTETPGESCSVRDVAEPRVILANGKFLYGRYSAAHVTVMSGTHRESTTDG